MYILRKLNLPLILSFFHQPPIHTPTHIPFHCTGLHADALKMLRGSADSPELVSEYLIHMGADQPQLVFEYSAWVLQKVGGERERREWREKRMEREREVNEGSFVTNQSRHILTVSPSTEPHRLRTEHLYKSRDATSSRRCNGTPPLSRSSATYSLFGMGGEILRREN